MVESELIETGARGLGVFATTLPTWQAVIRPWPVPAFDTSIVHVYPDRLQVAAPIATLTVPLVVADVTVLVTVVVETPCVTVLVTVAVAVAVEV